MAGFFCGAASRDITPSYPVVMHGYASRDGPSVGSAEPITLGCLALEERSGPTTRALIVTCDMSGIEEPDARELYALLEESVGIGWPNALLCCSHTHFAPALHPNRDVGDQTTSQPDDDQLPDPRFLADFKQKLVSAAQESLATLQPVALETARVAVPGAAFSRRWRRPDGSVSMQLLYPDQETRMSESAEAQPEPDGDSAATSWMKRTDAPSAVPLQRQSNDDQLTVLRFRAAEDGALVAALLNFGCHPVTGGLGVGGADEFMHISADFPHYMREVVSEEWGCPAFFCLGAAGDVVPMQRHGRSRAHVGRLLGSSAVLAEGSFDRDSSPRLAVEGREVPLAAAPTIPVAQLGRRVSWDAPIRIQLLTLGPLRIVAVPHEVFSDFALEMKRVEPNAMIISLAGGYEGYFPLAHEFESAGLTRLFCLPVACFLSERNPDGPAGGGYETSATSAYFKQGSADQLLQLVLGWLRASRQGAAGGVASL